MREIWKDINDKLEVSSFGNVRIKITKERKKGKINSNGYLYINFDGKREYVHRVVAKAFLKNPLQKRCVNHINSIKTDNRVDNLEWVSDRENVSHRVKLSRYTSGHTGVYLCKDNVYKKWVAKVRHNGNKIFLGSYITEQEAAHAYEKFLKENGIENKYL